eukprot:755020-Hanusia_phi.AAC.7
MACSVRRLDRILWRKTSQLRISAKIKVKSHVRGRTRHVVRAPKNDTMRVSVPSQLGTKSPPRPGDPGVENTNFSRYCSLPLHHIHARIIILAIAHLIDSKSLRIQRNCHANLSSCPSRKSDIVNFHTQKFLDDSQEPTVMTSSRTFSRFAYG